MDVMRMLVGFTVVGLTLLAAKTSVAQEAFGAADPDATKPAASTYQPSKAAASVGWSERRVDSQIKTGAIAWGAGYLGASLIPILANVDGPSKHPTEKALALIPIAGPGIYWFAALDRLSDRRAYEKAHPCESDAAWGCAFHDTAGIDTFFHAMIMAPYVILSTGAQVIGAVYLLQAAYHANDQPRRASAASTSVGAAKKPTVAISPTSGGFLVHGTF